MTEGIQRQVRGKDGVIEYLLFRKPVKNINIRIKSDGRVLVSANERVPLSYLDQLVQEKEYRIKEVQADLIKRLNTAAKKNPSQREEREFYELVEVLAKELYPIIEAYGIPFPEIKLRSMTSRWGSCRPYKNSITLNSRLIEADKASIAYVILHEFAHFIHPNHSRRFYGFVAQYMPDWKLQRDKLRDIPIP